jgi:hypothetical protein
MGIIFGKVTTGKASQKRKRLDEKYARTRMRSIYLRIRDGQKATCFFALESGVDKMRGFSLDGWPV